MARPKKNTSSTMSIKPLFDNVLIKPQEAEEKTASGIVLPDTAKDKPQIGIVMAIGPGALDDKGKRMPIDVKTGQKVIYTKWGGNEVKVGNEEWKVVKQTDILAVVA